MEDARKPLKTGNLLCKVVDLAAGEGFPHRNKVPNEPPKPSVMQMQRIVGAGSFRDTEPLPLPFQHATVMDLFRGQAMQGRFNANNLNVTLPISITLFLIASGANKLPFTNAFLDHLVL
ncbi:uncharacterized protein [Phaseolus vulgaris]|uniref:uncharacterized protein n=1 Tax=Phaseolus vulgaris TaxID=3885 RepID=UPI0035CA287E